MLALFNNSVNYDKYIWDRKFFPDKTDPSEDIIIVCRQDATIITFKFLGLFLGFFTLLVIRSLVSGFFDSFGMSIYDMLMWGVALLMIFVAFLLFHNYYLSIQIVTTKRIVDIDQKGLFSRENNELALSNIQDVTHTKNGFLANLFNFGDVIVKTSADETNTNGFIFEKVANPKYIADSISLLYHKEKNDSLNEVARLNAAAIKEALSEKDMLKK